MDVIVSFDRVENASPSTFRVHRKKRMTMRSRAVVPGIHTPYDFYERIYLNA
jgi:hypothetical protein